MWTVIRWFVVGMKELFHINHWELMVIHKKYPHSYIGGTILKKNDGQSKFIVMQGNHRTAIFPSRLHNHDVRLIPNSINYVLEKDLYKWIMVKMECAPKMKQLRYLIYFLKKMEVIFITSLIHPKYSHEKTKFG